jgi:hypothetical protein
MFGLGVLALVVVGILCIMAWRRSVRPARTGLLEALRFLCATTVVLLLWQPEWRTTIEPNEQPEIAILTDRSGSMTTADAPLPQLFSPKPEVVSRSDLANLILESEFWKPLEEDERNRVFLEEFAAPPEGDDPAVLALAGTDINAALERVLDTHPDLRSMILLTDGDWNTGDPPVAAAQKMRLRGVPLFPIAMGSESRLPDLDLLNVSAPTYGIVGENVQIPFTIESSLPRDVRTLVRLRDNSGVERTKDITIPAQGTYYDSILWRLTKDGTSTLDLSIPFADGELVEKNNKRKFTISGRPESIRVLVIETLPRWEYRFIRNALSRDPGVDVDCLLLHPKLGEGDGPEYIQEFPDKLEDLQKYDVVFIGDVGVGEGQLTEEQANLLKGLVEAQASGIVFIPGPQGNQFSLLKTELGALIPVVLDEKKKEGWGNSAPSPLTLTTEGRSSLLTMLGDTEEDNPNIWRSLPPFYWFAPIKRAKSGAEVLAVHANRRNPPYGRIPLITTSRAGNGKVLFMGIDSAWRWRRGVEDLYHYRFWGQVARWMSYQRNMAAGKRIRLYFNPERPEPGDNVTLNANAFEKGGAPLEDGTVIIDLTAPDGTTRRFELSRSDASWGAFTGRFKITQPGAWKISARTTDSPDSTVETTLLAQGVQLEKTGHPARPDVLAELAKVSRGRLVTPDQLPELLKELQTLPEPRAQIIPLNLWANWKVAAGLIGLLSFFWIGRKLNGTF